jgi:calcium/calmodulin-dependent protein kinase I
VKLGEGATGVVFKAGRYFDDTSGGKEGAWKYVAIKAIKKSIIGGIDFEADPFHRDLMMKIFHPNIVSIYQVVDTAKYLFVSMELAEGGELYNRITTKGRYTETKARVVAEKLASALIYLHNHRIIHRDLKPENILLKSADDVDVVLCDFGLSLLFPIYAIHSNSRHVLKDNACGSMAYVAPEGELPCLHKVHPPFLGVLSWLCLSCESTL